MKMNNVWSGLKRALASLFGIFKAKEQAEAIQPQFANISGNAHSFDVGHWGGRSKTFKMNQRKERKASAKRKRR